MFSVLPMDKTCEGGDFDFRHGVNIIVEKERSKDSDMEKVYEGNLVEVFEVLPDIYFRKANLPVRDQCNGAYFVGDYGVAAVDAPPGGIEMVEEAQKIFEKPIRWLFLTHGHGDHINGLDDFLDLDITIFCHRRLLDDLKPKLKSKKVNFVGVEGCLPMQFSGLEVELFTLPDITHSKWDMFIRLPQMGILCTGDAVVEYQTAFYHGTDLDTWIRSLKQLAGEEGKYIFAGHANEPYEYRYIDSFIDHLETVQCAAKDCFNKYNAGGGKTDKERFAGASSEDIAVFVEKYFRESDDVTAKIVERAGGEAQRQVRMALYALAREVLR